nr:hypothetical protein FFPRI1PSEUD_49320 [Pseudomonas sp. FFPRI_1]
MQEGDVVVLQVHGAPLRGQTGVQAVHVQQLRRALGLELVHLQQGIAEPAAGQQQARLGVGDDRDQALLVMTAGGLRWIGRHSDHARVQAGKKRRDIIRATGKQQHGAITQCSIGLQGGGNATRAKIQVPVTQDHALILLFGKKAQGHFIGGLHRPALQGLGQGAGEFERVRHGVSCQESACNGDRALLCHNVTNYR